MAAVAVDSRPTGLLSPCCCSDQLVLAVVIFFTTPHFTGNSSKPACIFVVLYKDSAAKRAKPRFALCVQGMGQQALSFPWRSAATVRSSWGSLRE
jgi:hypothetical protein